MKTKNQKGITLIALIITMIVMLILVGVSVSIALDNGLFKAAQGAAKGTNEHKENETKLSSGMVTIIDQDGNEQEVDINSFGASDEGGITISLSDNPTHILEYSGVKWEIDESTTFDEFVEKSIGLFGWYVGNDGSLTREDGEILRVITTTTWEGQMAISRSHIRLESR